MATYSNRLVEKDVSLFPAPQMWMTWVENRQWRWSGGSYTAADATGEGKLRHYYSLADARKGLRWLGSKSSYRAEEERGIFMMDWAVFHWSEDKQEWEKVYEGFTGDSRDDHPLFKIRFKKAEKVNPIDTKLEEAAVASILSSMR